MPITIAPKRRHLAIVAALALAATVAPQAEAASYFVSTSYCEGSACTFSQPPLSSSPIQTGIGVNAGASTYSKAGGIAQTRVYASPLLPGQVTNNISVSSLAQIDYAFRVVGAPGTFVPVNVRANVTATRIGATDINGQPYQLVDDPNYPGDKDGLKTPSNYQITSSAAVSVIQTSREGGRIGLERTEAFNALYGFRDSPGKFVEDAEGKGINIDRTFFFLSNTDILVQLTAQSTLFYSPRVPVPGLADSQFGFGGASADPIFTIADPAFGDFQIVGVPDGPGPDVPAAVPEPASWALMLIGVGATGAGLRRRRGAQAGCRAPA